MKKSFMILFSVLAIFMLSLGVASCGKDKHQHITTNWTEVVDATCEEDGYRKGICDKCGKEFSETITKLGHSLGEVVVIKGATCQEEGSTEQKCVRCDYKETKILPKTKHVPETVEFRVDPDCTNEGHTEKIVCSECETVLQEKQTLEAKGHSFGQWNQIIEPKCNQKGKMERICTVCEFPEFKDIDTIAHDFGEWDAHSGITGEHTRQCKNCQFEEKSVYAYNNKEFEEKATCDQDGRRYRICLICNEEVTYETLQSNGHNWKYEQVIVNEKTQHEHKHYQKCLTCGQTTEEEACELRKEGEESPATCTEARCQLWTCDTCHCIHEEVIGEANGHTWTYKNVTFAPPFISGFVSQHDKICSVCGETERQRCSILRKYTEAKCEVDAKDEYYCEYCEGKKSINYADTALKHNFGQWEFDDTTNEENPKHKHTCQRAGCGFSESSPCEIEETSTFPTCTEAGTVTKACRICFNAFTSKGSESVGHNWGEGWKPDQNDNTQHYRECLNCGEIERGKHGDEDGNMTVTKTEAKCEQDEVINEICDKCGFHKETVNIGTALKHNWTISKITADKHEASCSLCNKQGEFDHDFSESNLCSACHYDGLDYVVEGNHAYVKASDKIKKAKSKNIIINAKHKVLGADGQYEKTEYDVTIANSFFGLSMTTLSLPKTLTTITKNAFSSCNYLQHVDFEDDSALTTIEEFAFYNCAALASFEAPQTLKFIGEHAFANCVSLNEISIADSVEDIEPRAFYNTGFTNESSHWIDDMLYLGKHLIKARHTLKDGNYTNTTATVKEETLTIAANAFSECPELVCVKLPSSLKHIDSDAFLNCTKLSQVDFDGDVYEWLSIVFVNDYSSPLCYGNSGLQINSADGDIDLTDPQKIPEGRIITHIPSGTFRNTNLKSIKLPKTLISIGSEAFEDCALLESITFEDDECNVSYVGKDILKGCTAYLNNSANWDNDKVLYLGDKILIEAKTDLSGAYTVKEGTTVIVEGAFAGCENLQSVTLSASMLYVGLDAFSGCTNLNEVTFLDTSYVWVCTHRQFNIARGLSKNELNWNTLSSYSVWRRSYKDTVEP